jgi:20S proteasome alpha/beta subunit
MLTPTRTTEIGIFSGYKLSDRIDCMTVCIAALADNGKGIILATDKMLTSTNASVAYQYEQDDVKKIYHIGNQKIVLLAGTIQHAFAILENAKKKIGGEVSKKTLKEVIAIIKTEYDEYRNSWLEEGILKPRGIKDLHEYYAKHKDYQQSFTQQIDQLIGNAKFDVEFIVAGFENGEWGIFNITNSLQPQLKTTEGYATCGTGAPHATYVIIDSGYSKSMDRKAVEKIVKHAKIKSEKSPGVGKGLELEIYEGANKTYPSSPSPKEESPAE